MPLEQKPAVVTQPTKSSMEILSELFGTFDAEPPVIIKMEKDESKKHKKSKKKHKHKDKKHKKSKKRKRSDSSSSELDLAQLLIKQERKSPEKKLNIKDVDLTKQAEGAKEEDMPRLNSKGKIIIKDLKLSTIFHTTTNQAIRESKEEEEREEGEKTSDDEDVIKKSKRRKKHKHEEKSKRRKHSHCHRNKDGHKSERKKNSLIKLICDVDDYRSKSTSDKLKHKDKEDLKYKDYYKDKNYYNHRDRNSRSKSRDNYKYYYQENSFYKETDNHKVTNDKWFMKERYRGYSEADREKERKHRDRSTSRDQETHIDKKKLLEIARRNAIQMMKSGNLPSALTLGRQAQEKVLAAIKAGGKTIEELTDFCKSLSRKEELGELSSVSGEDNGNDSDPENRAFHHPFQIKDRPTAIVMNIKNSVPLPTKTAQERTAELRMQFPVSSGTQHRKTEKDWVPVSPKINEPTVPPTPPLPAESPPFVPVPPATVIPAILAPPPPPPPGPQVFPEIVDQTIDIGSIVSQRLSAMRKLQENPYDIEALNDMYKSQKEMQTWAESKQQPGQFTGSTGAQILSQAELSAGYQAWARKDQLQNAAPVTGGMGMHLLKKMGWNPGEGLGKEKSGALEPLLLEVKLDKRGLVAIEEQKKKQQKAQKLTVKTLEGKHPVSLLGEYTAKKKLGVPQYILCLESGPDHKKMFLFKVTVNGIEYQPDIASPNKKQAKADAARLCLQKMGLLPS